MKRRLAITAASLAIVAAIAIACGGDDNDAPRAEEIVPDLEEFGFTVVEEGRDPLARDEQDMYQALYIDPEVEGRAMSATVFVESDEETARREYDTLAAALQNPPPGFFGADAEQTEGEPLELADQQTAYVTATPDSQGRLVWTDIYRSGHVVFITRVLERTDADPEGMRTLIAERIIDESR